MPTSVFQYCATTEPAWVRYFLTILALLFLVFFLLLPLVIVFTEALQAGVATYFEALIEPDAVAAIRLTLLTAAIAVPLNLVFGFDDELFKGEV